MAEFNEPASNLKFWFFYCRYEKWRVQVLRVCRKLLLVHSDKNLRLRI